MRISILLFVLLCSGCGSSVPLEDAGPGFSFLSSIRFTSGHGWEGQYLRSRLTSRCNGDWSFGKARIMQGEITPGIIFDGEDFSGTPYDDGNWLLQVRIFEPECNGVIYSDRDVWINFSIKGDRKRNY